MHLADWLPPLAASLLGALVGALALFFVFLAERRNRRAERFETALAELLSAMIDISEKQSTYQQTYPGWENRYRHRSFNTVPDPPSDAGLTARLQVAKMLGNKVERELLQSLAGVITFASEVGLNHYCGVLMASAAEFALWRAKDVPTGRIRADFTKMQEEARSVVIERARTADVTPQQQVRPASEKATPDP